jgi:hypothetical protein
MVVEHQDIYNILLTKNEVHLPYFSHLQHSPRISKAKCLVPIRSINSTVMTVLHVWLENFVRISLGNPRRDGYSISLPCTSNRLAVLKDRSVEDAMQGFAGVKGMSYVPPPEKFTQTMNVTAYLCKPARCTWTIPWSV